MEQRSVDREVTVRIVIERVRSGVYEEAAYVAVLWARTALFHCDFEPIDKVGKHYRRGATASETVNNGTMNVWKILLSFYTSHVAIRNNFRLLIHPSSFSL